MTYLDKFRREHPLMRKRDILMDYCPEDRLIVSAAEDDPDGHASMCPMDDWGETMSCIECWLRPVPQEPPTVGGLTEEGPDRT